MVRTVMQCRGQFAVDGFALEGIRWPTGVSLSEKCVNELGGERETSIQESLIQKNVKLSRLLLVSDWDWRKLPAEAGAEAARKVARRNLNFFLNASILAATPRAVRCSTALPDFGGIPWLSQGLDLDRW